MFNCQHPIEKQMARLGLGIFTHDNTIALSNIYYGVKLSDQDKLTLESSIELLDYLLNAQFATTPTRRVRNYIDGGALNYFSIARDLHPEKDSEMYLTDLLNLLKEAKKDPKAFKDSQAIYDKREFYIKYGQYSLSQSINHSL